ncbi:hypothetical protein [Pilimelia columellifera]|uniref:Uncharacterized protein n=1 Tax=Pilimelia columellifera subsp. columellifera TaxID=706583 RepID=A0ABN3NQN3_9ACTN
MLDIRAVLDKTFESAHYRFHSTNATTDPGGPVIRSHGYVDLASETAAAVTEAPTAEDPNGAIFSFLLQNRLYLDIDLVEGDTDGVPVDGLLGVEAGALTWLYGARDIQEQADPATVNCTIDGTLAIAQAPAHLASAMRASDLSSVLTGRAGSGRVTITDDRISAVELTIPTEDGVDLLVSLSLEPTSPRRVDLAEVTGKRSPRDLFEEICADRGDESDR